MRRFILCLVLASSAALAQAADNTERAREAFGAAQQLYQASKFAEALKKFEQAQALKPHPVIVFNIARCHEQLGAVPQALKAYREYLRLSPAAADKDSVVASIAALEKRLPQATAQQLVVNTEPAASQVVVNGKRLGAAPVTVDLPPGEHVLEVSAAGYEPLKRQVTLAPQRTVELNITLKAKPVAAPPEPVVKAPPPVKEPPVVAKVTPIDAPKKEPELRPVDPPPERVELTQPAAPAARSRPLTWIIGGAALASVAAASGMGLGAHGAEIELKSGDGTRSRAQAGALADQATGLATGSNVAWGLAGAAAITAVVLFFVEGAPPAK